MPAYINLKPYLTVNPKYQIPPRPFRDTRFAVAIPGGAVHVTSVPIGYKESPYQSFLKNINVSTSVWNINIFQTGVETISGILQENNKPINGCLICLHQSSTGILASSTFSKEDGSFRLTGIVADTSYYIVAIHNKKTYNAVVLDNIRIDSRA